jgi:hypothetical protein
VGGRFYRLLAWLLSGHEVIDILEKHLVKLGLWIVERIDLSLLHTADQVIHVAVLSFVSTNSLDEIQDGTILSQLPVRNCNLWSTIVLPLRKLRSLWSDLNGLDDFGVSVASFLFDVANEAMAELGADEVRRQEGNTESKLSTNDGSTEEGGWILQSDECEEAG